MPSLPLPARARFHATRAHGHHARKALLLGVSVIIIGVLSGCGSAVNMRADTQNLDQVGALNTPAVEGTASASTRTRGTKAHTDAAGSKQAFGTHRANPPAKPAQAKPSTNGDKATKKATRHAESRRTTAATWGYSQQKVRIPTSKPAKGSTALPADSGSGRRIIYAKTAQRVWLVRADNSVERTYLVSGRMDQPDPGVYTVFSKSRHATSAVLPPATMQYMVRFTKGLQGNNIGFHDLPLMRNGKYEQSEAQLGQPLSAGCVRQSVRDAAFLWRWAPVGTSVVVLA